MGSSSECAAKAVCACLPRDAERSGKGSRYDMRKNTRIETVIRAGMRSNGKFFCVYALLGEHPAHKSFIVIVVGKKQHRLATARNRIKRRTMAAARGFLVRKLKGYAVVIYPSPRALEAPYKSLCDEITAHVVRIKNYHSTHRRIPAHHIS